MSASSGLRTGMFMAQLSRESKTRTERGSNSHANQIARKRLVWQSLEKLSVSGATHPGLW